MKHWRLGCALVLAAWALWALALLVNGTDEVTW